MKTPLTFAAISMSLAIGITAPVSAQDISAEPNSETVLLESGFIPDPVTVDVISGGSVDVSVSVPACNGYISEAPDVRLTYVPNDAPNAAPLYIYAKSSGDTTLLINAPDGSWYCNDDGSDDNNPLVIFGPAMSGDYEIWVGSFDDGEYHEATLEFSEINGQ